MGYKMPPFFIEGVLLSRYAYDIKAQRQKRKFQQVYGPPIKAYIVIELRREAQAYHVQD